MPITSRNCNAWTAGSLGVKIKGIQMRSQSQQIIEIFGLRGLRKSFKVKVKETIRSQTFKSTFSKT